MKMRKISWRIDFELAFMISKPMTLIRFKVQFILSTNCRTKVVKYKSLLLMIYPRGEQNYFLIKIFIANLLSIGNEEVIKT